MLYIASYNHYRKLKIKNASNNANRLNNKYNFYINSQDITINTIPFLISSTKYINNSFIIIAITTSIYSLLITYLYIL